MLSAIAVLSSSQWSVISETSSRYSSESRSKRKPETPAGGSFGRTIAADSSVESFAKIESASEGMRFDFIAT